MDAAVVKMVLVKVDGVQVRVLVMIEVGDSYTHLFSINEEALEM